MAYNDQNDPRYITSHESTNQSWRLPTVVSELKTRCKRLEEDNKRLNDLVHKYKTEFEVETSYLKNQVDNEREKQAKWKNLYYDAHAELSDLKHHHKLLHGSSNKTKKPPSSNSNNNNSNDSNDKNNNNQMWRRVLPPQNSLDGGCLECENERKRTSSETETASMANLCYPSLNILTPSGSSSIHPSPKEHHLDDASHHVNVYPSPSPHPKPTPFSQLSTSSISSPKGQQTGTLYYDCRICGMRYDSEQKLHFHGQVHTPVRSRHQSMGEYPSELAVSSSTGSSSEYWNCPECAQSFIKDDDYRRHLLIHMFKCRYCGIVLDSENNFVMHMQTHNEAMPLFTCFLCDKQFPAAQQLHRHLLSHPDELNFTCKECNKGFARKFQLTRHITAAHSQSKPYNCNDCGKKFAHKTHLRRHEIVHSGLKPHQCKVCHQSFSRKSSLSRHYFIHTTEKPFVCPVCEKGFNRKGRLKNHLNIHIREGHAHLVDYVIERRPITREFIEQINQVRDETTLPDDMGYTTMSDIHQRAPSFVVKSEPHDYEIKEHGASYEKEESDESSCSDSDEGELDDADMSEEITFDQPHQSSNMNESKQGKTVSREKALESTSTTVAVRFEGNERTFLSQDNSLRSYDQMNRRPNSRESLSVIEKTNQDSNKSASEITQPKL